MLFRFRCCDRQVELQSCEQVVEQKLCIRVEVRLERAEQVNVILAQEERVVVSMDRYSQRRKRAVDLVVEQS